MSEERNKADIKELPSIFQANLAKKFSIELIADQRPKMKTSKKPKSH